MIECNDIERNLIKLKLIFNTCKIVENKDLQLLIDVIDAIDRCKEDSGGDSNAVLYTPQLKSEAEKLIARINIGAVSEQDLEDIVQEIIITELQPQYHHFSSEQIVPIEHNLNKYPKVTVLIGTEEVYADIEHNPDMNHLTVKFSKPETGIIVVQ